MSRTRLETLRRDLRRAVLARRRALAAIFAALAVITTVQAARPQPTTQDVLVATSDLRAGEVLSADDVESVDVDPGVVPAGAVDAISPPIGRTLAGPVRAGEPLTDVRFVQAELLAGFPPGTVLATIRVFDPATAALVDPGDRVDVVGTDPRGAGTSVVASDAAVVARPASDTTALGDGAPLVLAVDESAALALADAAVRQQLTILIV
jgi:Flp pilus assembly protein CpaB